MDDASNRPDDRRNKAHDKDTNKLYHQIKTIEPNKPLNPELDILIPRNRKRNKPYNNILPGDRKQFVATTTEAISRVDSKYDEIQLEEVEVEEMGEPMEESEIVYVEYSEDNGVRVGYEDDVKTVRRRPALHRVKKKPLWMKQPVKTRFKTGNRNRYKVKKSQIRRKGYKCKQETTTEDYVEETTTMGYNGAVIAFQPAYQIVKNKVHLGIASTFFPYLTGEEVVGPVYGTIPLFSTEEESNSGSVWSHLWSGLWRRRLFTMKVKTSSEQ